MSLFEDIRRQPRHVREMMFALCVVITVSLVGLIWFRSFEKNIFVLMNPDPKKQEQFFAERAKNTPTLVASFQSTYGVLKAGISQIFLLGDSKDIEKTDTVAPSQKTYLLPLPGKK